MEELTVKSLKFMLSTLPEDMRVGKIGHYGEFHTMDKYSFSVVPIMGETERVLDVHTPDIGPEPD